MIFFQIFFYFINPSFYFQLFICIYIFIHLFIFREILFICLVSYYCASILCEEQYFSANCSEDHSGQGHLATSYSVVSHCMLTPLKRSSYLKGHFSLQIAAD